MTKFQIRKIRWINMKPAKFNYFKPKTLDETFRLLDKYGFEAQILAGGQSLVPTMNLRLAEPEYIIDINGISDLYYINLKDNELRIGALTRQSELERSKLVKDHCKLLHRAVPYIGHFQTRNSGTIGGSIVHADPSAELPLILTTLGGSVVISSSDGERVVDAEDLFITYLTTDILSNEVLTEIRIPTDDSTCGVSFQEVVRRHGDFALVSVAAYVVVDEQ